MPTSGLSRRAVLGATAAAMPALLLGRRSMAQTAPAGTGDFVFEVTRSDDEWASMLSEQEYKVLRQGATEVPKSDPHWDSMASGTYACVGCDLDLYDARWKVVLDIGWLFFRHSQPNAVLTGIDTTIYDRFRGPDAVTEGAVVPDATPAEMPTPVEQALIDGLTAIEVHCRRCGSHLGHVIHADGKLLHCINGAALDFAASG